MADREDPLRAFAFDCEVVDYHVVGNDPSYYNNHVFMIKVWIKQHMYAVNRSYAAFCELDCRLRKQYARSNLPTLKLVGASAALKIAKKNSMNIDLNKVVVYPPEFDGDKAQERLFRRVDAAETISQKKKHLTFYLQQLLKIPEVVVSEVLLYFLDEESIHGEVMTEQPEEQADCNEVNILLNGMEMTTKVVRADRQQPISVADNTVVVWAFNTLNHDIGFSIVHKNKEIYKYQRCDSHHKIIKGQFLMEKAGEVTFIWDNSYSRWRSKTVNYAIRGVSAAEYAEAQETASQQKKHKILFAKQRNMVKMALSALSARILAARGNTIAATAAVPLLSTTTPSTDADAIKSASESAPKSTSGWQIPINSEIRAEDELSARLEGNTGIPGYYHTSHPSSHELTGAPPAGNKSNNSSRRYIPTDTSEFLDLSDAVKEINKLRNEKKTLQQALGESESALVTERSVAAQYTRQYEELTLKCMAQEEELNELKTEFELFRENYFNEMESKLAETLATFAPNGNGDDISTLNTNSQVEPLILNNSGEKVRKSGVSSGSATGSDVHSAEDSVTNLFIGGFSDTSIVDSDKRTAPEKGSESADDSENTPEVSFNQLLAITPAELSTLPVNVLMMYYTKLNEHTKLIVKRGYLTKEIENMINKLKSEKRQLKAYALQMKQALDKMSMQYIHIDQDKAQLLVQVRELRDLVALLETDRRGLREHISQLLSNDTAPVKGATPDRSQISCDKNSSPNLQNSDASTFPSKPAMTMVISMEDLKQASAVMQQKAETPPKPLLVTSNEHSANNITVSVDDTGSDCGYSVSNDIEDSSTTGYDLDNPFLSRSTSTGDGINNSDRAHSTGSISSFPGENGITGMGFTRKTSEGSGKSENVNSSTDDMPFSRVTEQLYGILPTWGQLQAFRTKSLI